MPVPVPLPPGVVTTTSTAPAACAGVVAVMVVALTTVMAVAAAAAAAGVVVPATAALAERARFVVVAALGPAHRAAGALGAATSTKEAGEVGLARAVAAQEPTTGAAGGCVLRGVAAAAAATCHDQATGEGRAPPNVAGAATGRAVDVTCEVERAAAATVATEFRRVGHEAGATDDDRQVLATGHRDAGRRAAAEASA